MKTKKNSQPAARAESVPEIQLISAAQQGSEAAFKALFDRHKQYVYSLCRRAAEQPGDAEELTRQTFIRIFRNIASVRGESDFSAWVRRAAVSEYLAFLRKKRQIPSPRSGSLLAGPKSQTHNEPSPIVSDAKPCPTC